MRGYLSWEKEEKRKQNEVPGENSGGSRGDPFVELEADLPAGEPPKKRSVKGKRRKRERERRRRRRRGMKRKVKERKRRRKKKTVPQS